MFPLTMPSAAFHLQAALCDLRPALSGHAIRLTPNFFKSMVRRGLGFFGVRIGEEERDLIEQRRTDTNKASILFVHGFGGDARKTWEEFQALLAADPHLVGWDIYSLYYDTGISWDLLVGIWSADPDLVGLAILLKTRAAIPPLKNYDALVLIAHSMGGLIVQRALVEYPEFLQRVSHVFLFGTPSAGLVKAGAGSWLKRQMRDMAPRSDFLIGLRKRWAEEFGANCPFRLQVIAGARDQFVPQGSSLDPFPAESHHEIRGDHLSIVKPKKADDPSVLIVLCELTHQALGPTDSARWAIERKEFQKAIEILWPVKEGLEEAGLVELALALEAVGRQDDAVQILEKSKGNRTDAMGTLAGRYKRRWLLQHQESDALRALELYQHAYELSKKASKQDQSFYHGVNIAFFEYAYRRNLEAAREWARRVLEHCEKAHKQEPPGAKPDFWRLATEGEAYLFLGDIVQAIEHYEQAVQEGPKPRQLDSMYREAIYVAELLRYDQAVEQLDHIFRGKS